VQLVYVFDAYCGWCHGFSDTMRAVAARHPDVPVEVVSGGLFTGSRQVPIREFGYIPDANAQISEVTGASFGEAYQSLVAEGSFVMDSQAAARGLAALRQAAPARAVELAAAVQNAFYLDGLSLSDPRTYRTIASAAGLDADAVVAAFHSGHAAAEGDFERTARLGVSGFPTLLAVRGSDTVVLARGHATADQVEQHLATLR